MKYLLKQNKEDKGILCDKVTIGGFDYYFSNENPTKDTKPCYCYNSIKKTWDEDIVFFMGTMPMYHFEGFKIIIATTDFNIDIPKVVVNIDIIASNEFPDDGWGRVIFSEGYKKSQETHPFSGEDMIAFTEWVDKMGYTQVEKGLYKSLSDEKGKFTKELLQIWGEQQPKVIYYQ